MAFLIVGGGLAGIAISEQLRTRNIDFKVVDSRRDGSSTSIATGMFNPVVFKRINLSWMTEELLPVMKSFYRSLERLTGKPILQEIDLSRFIPSADYKTLWENRRLNAQYSPYLGEVQDQFASVLQAGIVDCGTLMESYHDWLENSGRLIQMEFDFNRLIVDDQHITFEGTSYDQVIFCEGAYAANNPYFHWLPWKLSKGEWIIIETPKPITKNVVNHKINVIPLGENRYKLSSTFEWEDLSWQTTEKGKLELIDGFKSLFDTDFKLVDQHAGVRPTVGDRRPYLGRHPIARNISIFNGLGTKGVMLAPYFSNHLVDHLIEDKPLMKEVNIERHIGRFRKSHSNAEVQN